MKRSLYIAAGLTGLCLSLAMVTLSLSGCSQLGQAINIQNPTYSLRNLQPHIGIALPLSASTIDFDFDLGVDNPNAVALRLAGINFDMLVNGNRLLTSQSNQGVNIPARGYGSIHLRSRVTYDDIRSIFQQVTDMIQGNRANYEVRGTAFFDTPAGPMNFPVTVYMNR
ncbi:MAG: LEA type 2 family protein [Thermoanaerobaculia bacterium]